MNVLVTPLMYSSKRFTGISNVNFFAEAVAHVNKFRDDVYWDFAVPCTKEYIDWDDSDFAHLERVRLLPILSPAASDATVYKDGFAGTDQPFFSPLCFKHFSEKDFPKYDVVLSRYCTANFVVRWQSEYSAKYHYMLPKIGLPAVINVIGETTLDKDLPKLDCETGRLLLATGMASSALTLVLTPADVSEMLSIARSMLSPSQVKKLAIYDILPAIDKTRVPQHQRPQDRCTFFHGGTFEAKRHLKFLAESVEKLFTLGKKANLQLCTQWEKAPQWFLEQGDWLLTKTAVSRSQFYEEMKNGDFVLCYIDYEGTGLATTECIVSGMTPIIMQRPWNKGRYSPTYPFYCKNENDFVAAMNFCASNPKKAKEIGQTEIARVRRDCDSLIIGERWSAFLDKAVAFRNNETRTRAKGHFMLDLVGKAVSTLPDQFTKEELIKAVALQSRSLDKSKVVAMWWVVRACAMASGTKEISPTDWRKE